MIIAIVSSLEKYSTDDLSSEIEMLCLEEIAGSVMNPSSSTQTRRSVFKSEGINMLDALVLKMEWRTRRRVNIYLATTINYLSYCDLDEEHEK